jgi:hypothetical protein
MGPYNAVPDFEGFTGCVLSATSAQLDYPSDGFMSLYVRKRTFDGQLPTLLVHVGPTDTCHLHFDQNAPGFYFWNRDFPDL